MKKISELLQMGLDLVAKDQETPECGMCVFLARMHGRKLITEDEQLAAEEFIQAARDAEDLGQNAFLVDALRVKHGMVTDIENAAVYALWVKWYEARIAELIERGE